MTNDKTDIEQRIFELLGEPNTTPQIARELGMTVEEAYPLVMKVLEERGTPNLAALGRALDRLDAISFV